MFFICQVFAKKIFIFTKTARAEKFIGKRPLYLLRFCFDFYGFHSRLCDSFYNRFVFGPIGIVESAYDKIGIKLSKYTRYFGKKLVMTIGIPIFLYFGFPGSKGKSKNSLAN